MNNNDSRIMELKSRIDKKKVQLQEVPKFNPETNCSIELDGVRYNLHAATKSSLIFLLCKLHVLSEAAWELSCADDLIIDGYNVDAWIRDVRSKLACISYQAEMKKLKSLESKLDSMLSDDKKTELEINDIAKLLSSDE